MQRGIHQIGIHLRIGRRYGKLDLEGSHQERMPQAVIFFAIQSKFKLIKIGF